MAFETRRATAGAMTTLLRHYTRGIVGLLLLALLVRFVAAIWSGGAIGTFWGWLTSGGLERPALAVAAVLLLPVSVGWIVGDLLLPRLSRWRGARSFFAFQEQLVTELAPDAARGYAIVIVDWPSSEIGTLGVLGSSTKHPGRDEEFAAVFMPKAPDPTKGDIRMVSRSAIHITDWTLRDFWSFQLSLGTVMPDSASMGGELRGE